MSVELVTKLLLMLWVSQTMVSLKMVKNGNKISLNFLSSYLYRFLLSRVVGCAQKYYYKSVKNKEIH